MEDPSKYWKYNENDFKEAELWAKYMQMYEDVFENCNDPDWTVVPADQNWYKEFVVAKKLADALESLNMKFPERKETLQSPNIN